jgi:hypothetical protein
MTRVSKNRCNFSCSLPPLLLEKLDRLRFEQNVSRSEVIRALLEKALETPYKWPDFEANPVPLAGRRWRPTAVVSRG